MSYDWTQHLNPDRISGGRAGRRPARSAVVIGVSASELRTDFDFWVHYLRTIVDGWLLPNRDDEERRCSFCNAMLDLLDSWDREAEVFAGLRKTDQIEMEY